MQRWVVMGSLLLGIGACKPAPPEGIARSWKYAELTIDGKPLGIDLSKATTDSTRHRIQMGIALVYETSYLRLRPKGTFDELLRDTPKGSYSHGSYELTQAGKHLLLHFATGGLTDYSIDALNKDSLVLSTQNGPHRIHVRLVPR